ncbi:alpha/beta fold hydrolase [Flavobacterium sp. ZT3R17]|uniref:alpha/beta fold hydrolase n=1 Tax=Flavobacterium cryoconiti TaxID=3398736 RepID=UPI003A8BEB37
MSSIPTSSDLLYFIERGSGQPLLLVHGLMVTGDMFEPVIEHFATRHRVIVPDLSGHGQSRGLPPPYNATQQAADLSRLLDHLGIKSTAVLGYSHGGTIAQQLVLDYPNRCNHLILTCTYAFNLATFREKLEGHLVPFFIRVLGMKRFAKFVISQGLQQLDKEHADWILGLIADQDRDLMLSAWKETMAFDSRQRLAQIKCPTLIMAASKDEAVPLHHAKMLHEGIMGSQLVIVAGANHALIWSHTDEFIQIVDKFLAT